MYLQPSSADIISPSGSTLYASIRYPKISIVTPSLNQAEFLDACIDSILSQNYPNLEYIIMDGGSTDGSVEIIKKYEKHLAFWRSAPDGGHYAAVNDGLSRSTGEIMGWLNSDDMLHLKSLFILAEVFTKRRDIEFLTGRRVGFNKEGERKLYDFDTQRWSRKILLDEENLLDPVLCVMQEATYWRRSLWARSGAKLDLSYKYAADLELWARFSRHAALHTIDACIGGFREHGKGQRSSEFRDKYYEEWDAVIRRENNAPLELTVRPDLIPELIQFPILKTEEITNKPPKRRRSFPLPQYSIAGRELIPKISIVTPSLNQGDYLEECIDSVLSQTKCNVEYIIMDGGSTDGSVEIIKKYERYLRYWESKPDGGHYSAINEGFRHSTGEIMAWLNADDKYHINSLSLVSAVFACRKDVEWVTGLPTSWNEDGDLFWTYCRLPLYSREAFSFTNFLDPWIQQESTLWRRTLWDKAGGSLDTKWKFAADAELWRRFFRHAQLFTMNHMIAGFRIQPDQRSGIYRQKYFVEAKKILREELGLFHSGQYRTLLPEPKPILSL